MKRRVQGASKRRPGRKAGASGTSTTHSREWQHPFVDVFKQFSVGTWSTAEKRGDVHRVLVRPWRPAAGGSRVFVVCIV